MNRLIISLFVIAAFVVAPLVVSAAIITVPTDLDPGDTYRLAFATSTKRDGTSSDIADYNSFVAGVAAGVTELALLGTTWTAICSTADVDVRDNTGTNPSSDGDPIYRLDDTRIASNNADLWDGTIAAPIATTENGDTPYWTGVWTGIYREGDLNHYPMGHMAPYAGYNTKADMEWMCSFTQGKSVEHSMYAMSGVLTVVPEPSTLLLVCIGATAVVGCRPSRRRQRRRQ